MCLLLCGCAAGAEPTVSTEPETLETSLPPQTEPPVTVPPDPVEVLLENMTTAEKVGQIFLARCPDRYALEDIQNYQFGGYILFDRDFEGKTPDTLRDTLRAYQAASRIPMLLAVDEEGGTVCRVSSKPAFRFERFPSPRTLYGQGGLDLVLSVESEKAMLLSNLGINVNMAPVCDITTNSGAFMYSRSLGQPPEVVGEFAAGAVARMGEYGVGAVIKHFPGYGNNADTHTGIAVDSRSLDQLEGADIVPFMAGMRSGGAILTSHTIVEAFGEPYPASLSPVVHDYIRKAMGFDGVIVTDDLVMDAIRKQYGAGESAVLAVLAGNDLLISSEYPEQYAAVLEAAESGRIPMELLDRAVTRVLRWKQQLNLIQ